MCHYCGCRDIPLIKEFIAEHERVTNAAGDALRALDRGDVVRARALVDVMAVELAAHWRGEEDGLFSVMREASLAHRAVRRGVEQVDGGVAAGASLSGDDLLHLTSPHLASQRILTSMHA
ncbi:hypothetical protein [Streptomyces sp. NPDC087300]|uniref:hypothetical protein n=1 Tax=Streptomyces sp. NPDC087300 TaxID=3365780 RepID=UPI00381983D4